MQPVRHNPWRIMNGLSRDVDRLLAGTFDQEGGPRWVPAVDVREEATRFLIEADVPGVNAENLDITLENGVLTIEGQRELDKTEDRQGYYRAERLRGGFRRQFRLPESAASEGLEAEYKDGVLRVIVPKQAKAEPYRIKVQAN